MDRSSHQNTIIQPKYISKIILKNQLLTHSLFGLPMVSLLVFSWGISLQTYIHLAVYYLSIYSLIYIPTFLYLPHILNKNVILQYYNLINSKPADINNELAKLITLTFSLPSRYQSSIFFLVLLAYLFSIIVFNSPLFPELRAVSVSISLATLLIGIIVASTESLLTYTSLIRHSSLTLETIIKDYPGFAVRPGHHRTQNSIYKRTILTLLLGSSVVLLALNSLYLTYILIFAPEILGRMALFTIPTNLVNLIFTAILTIRFAKSVVEPIKKIESWSASLTEGKAGEKISYITSDELLPIITHANKLVQDLSDRSAQLKVDRQRQQDILANLATGIIVCKKNGSILFLNEAVKKILHIDPSYRTIRLSLNLLIRPVTSQQGNPLHSWLDLFRHESVNIKSQLYTMNSQTILVSINTQSLKRSTDSEEFIINLIDLTKDAELEQMKDDFVSIAAHELRTPLTSVRNYLSLFEEETQSRLSDEERLYLDRARASTEQLQEIMESFLTASKIDRDLLTLQKTSFDWDTFISEILTTLKPTAQEKQLSLVYRSPDKPITIRADIDRLHEVFSNLLENAIKYTPQGTVSISCTYDPIEQKLQVNIKDSGIGIPANAIPKLFTKFYRAPNASQVGIKGTGIGLYVVKTLVELHGGSIWVESTENQGSTFHVTLPIK